MPVPRTCRLELLLNVQQLTQTDRLLLNKLLISILCCNFAHDYRNRPFCSPAIFVEFIIDFLTIVCSIITARNIL